jgi:rhodanese-related sulfurtransferase
MQSSHDESSFDDDDDATVGNEDDRMTERHRAIIRKAEYHCGAFDVPVLTAQELIALREKDDAKVIVVDVRTAAERRVARLPRSVSRCYFEKALRLNADAASLRGVKIVVICTVGRRSGHYARQLVMRGCENVFNSQGIVACETASFFERRRWRAVAIAAIACRGSRTSTRASRRLRGGIRITRRYSHHHLARGTGPHALVDEEGRPATRLHVYARPWDLGSERFESVRFGLVGAARAAMFG